MELDLHIRKATLDDLPAIVHLLADDFLGEKRECFLNPLPQSYLEAFDEISHDNKNNLIVVESNQKIIGTLQMTFLINLTYQGSQYALIEGVRVNKSFRGMGVGRYMLEWAINYARQAHCQRIQLTTDKLRVGAFEFYKKIGFVPSHEGLKLFLHQV